MMPNRALVVGIPNGVLIRPVCGPRDGSADVRLGLPEDIYNPGQYEWLLAWAIGVCEAWPVAKRLDI